MNALEATGKAIDYANAGSDENWNQRFVEQLEVLGYTLSAVPQRGPGAVVAPLPVDDGGAWKWSMPAWVIPMRVK